jgi:hypothetical protein
VARLGERGKAYTILVKKRLRKQPITRPRRRWHDNMKSNFIEIYTDDERCLRIVSMCGTWY